VRVEGNVRFHRNRRTWLFPARSLVFDFRRKLRAGKKLWAARSARGNTGAGAAQNGREVREARRRA